MKRNMFFPFFGRPKRNISRQQTKKISQPQPILGIFKNAGILNFLVEFAILKIYFIMIPGTALFRRLTIRKTHAINYDTFKRFTKLMGISCKNIALGDGCIYFTANIFWY